MVFRLNEIHTKSLPRKPLGDKIPQEILRDLEILSRRIGTHVKIEGRPLKIELSGGLAIPLTISQKPDLAKFLDLPSEQKGIYRNHSAFHLSMYAPELLKLEKILTNSHHSSSKYALVTHPFSAGIRALHWKVDLYQKVNAEEAINERVHNLRFVEVDDAGEIIWPHKNRLSYFDVYPFLYQNKAKELVTPWHGNNFALDHRVFSPNEVNIFSWDKQELVLSADLYAPTEVKIGLFSIRVVGLPWIRLVKQNRERQDRVDRYDISLIERYLSLRKAQEGN